MLCGGARPVKDVSVCKLSRIEYAHVGTKKEFYLGVRAVV
jgi:hypothetical protein